MEYPGGLAPAELVPRLHQALVLGVLPQARDLVALLVVEALGVGIARNNDVGPVSATLKKHVVIDLERKKQSND